MANTAVCYTFLPSLRFQLMCSAYKVIYYDWRRRAGERLWSEPSWRRPPSLWAWHLCRRLYGSSRRGHAERNRHEHHRHEQHQHERHRQHQQQHHHPNHQHEQHWHLHQQHQHQQHHSHHQQHRKHERLRSLVAEFHDKADSSGVLGPHRSSQLRRYAPRCSSLRFGLQFPAWFLKHAYPSFF